MVGDAGECGNKQGNLGLRLYQLLEQQLESPEDFQMNKNWASAEDDVEDEAMTWVRGRPLYMSETDKQTIIELMSTIDRSIFNS